MSRTASAMSWTAEHTYSLPPTKMPHSALEPGTPHTPNRPWNYQKQDLARSWNWTEETRTDPQIILGRPTFGNYRTVTKLPYPDPLKQPPPLPPPGTAGGGYQSMMRSRDGRRVGTASTMMSNPSTAMMMTYGRAQAMEPTSQYAMGSQHPGRQSVPLSSMGRSEREVEVPSALKDPKWRDFHSLIKTTKEGREAARQVLLRNPTQVAIVRKSMPHFQYTRRQRHLDPIPGSGGSQSPTKQFKLQSKGGWHQTQNPLVFMKGGHVPNPNSPWVPNFLCAM